MDSTAALWFMCVEALVKILIPQALLFVLKYYAQHCAWAQNEHTVLVSYQENFAAWDIKVNSCL